MDADKPLLEVHPSWWNYFWYLLFSWLIIPLLIAWWKRAELTLRVTDDKVILEQGLLSKRIKDIFVTDIRTVDVEQSLLQRIFGIGDIKIATSSTDNYEDVAQGLPHPRDIQDLISRQRRKHEARKSQPQHPQPGTEN